MSELPKIRLYVDHPLRPGEEVALSRDQAHYLFGVMRLGVGSAILVFDGSAGEFLAEVSEAGKRGGSLRVGVRTRALHLPPDVWLIFAPIKKARTDFIVEKAAELGAKRILPVQTDFTNSERIRRDRLQAHAVEAAEQCGGTYVPTVTEMMPLARLLDSWPEDRGLIFADEVMAGERPALETAEGSAWAILIGPEGGFSPAERARLRAMPETLPLSLGPRILRADTAAVAALTLFQAHLGDWV